MRLPCPSPKSGPDLPPTALGDTPIRRRIFVCHPQSPADEGACAKRILSTVARRAFRQPVADADIQTLIEFFETGQKAGGFDAGIEQGLARVLVDPRYEEGLVEALAAAAALPRPNLAARAAAEPHDIRRQVDRIEDLLERAAAGAPAAASAPGRAL